MASKSTDTAGLLQVDTMTASESAAPLVMATDHLSMQQASTGEVDSQQTDSQESLQPVVQSEVSKTETIKLVQDSAKAVEYCEGIQNQFSVPALAAKVKVEVGDNHTDSDDLSYSSSVSISNQPFKGGESFNTITATEQDGASVTVKGDRDSELLDAINELIEKASLIGIKLSERQSGRFIPHVSAMQLPRSDNTTEDNPAHLILSFANLAHLNSGLIPPNPSLCDTDDGKSDIFTPTTSICSSDAPGPHDTTLHQNISAASTEPKAIALRREAQIADAKAQLTEMYEDTGEIIDARISWCLAIRRITDRAEIDWYNGTPTIKNARETLTKVFKTAIEAVELADNAVLLRALLEENLRALCFENVHLDMDELW